MSSNQELLEEFGVLYYTKRPEHKSDYTHFSYTAKHIPTSKVFEKTVYLAGPHVTGYKLLCGWNKASAEWKYTPKNYPH